MGSRAFVGVLAGLVVWLTPGPALASPGDLDPSFGKFGIVGGAGGAAKDLELLPGGDAVYLSSSVNGSGSSVERVGGSGRLIASYALPESFGAAALAVQPDGAIVVSGAVGGSAAAVRVRPGGALDPSFGGGGVAVIDIPGSFEIAEDVVVDEGGRAVLAVAAGSSGAGLYRLDSDGSVDPGFGEPAVPSGLEGRPTKLVLDPSGGYLLGSGFAEDFQATAQVTRFDGAGEVDSDFGAGGTVSFRREGDSAGVDVLSVDALNRPLVAFTHGITFSKGNPRQEFLRLGPNGEPDPSFDVGSLLSGESRYAMSLRDLELDGSGRMLFAGYWRPDYPSLTAAYATVGRLLPDGSPDRAFGDRGTSAFNERVIGVGGFHSLARLPGGRLVALGNGRVSAILARFLVDPGAHDADADGLRDRRDACPRSPARRKGGCPLFPVQLRLIAPAFGFAVDAAAHPGCLRKGKIRVFERLRGPDRRVGRLVDGSIIADLELRVDRGAGTYYATYARKRLPGLGICPKARSRFIRVEG